MISKDEYRDMITRTRKIHRITRRLSRLPQNRLEVDMDTALDVDYINEWLDIILCRICGQPAVEMPLLPDNPDPMTLYCYCMKKARKQAARLRFGLLTGRIGRVQLCHNAWEGIDSVETMLLCSAMGAVRPRRWRR